MITLDQKLFWESYKEANETDGIEVFESIDQSLLDWLENNILNKELLGLLKEFPLAQSVQLCAHYFYTIYDIKENTEMYESIKKTYVVLGSSACGDWIAVPRESWDSIGYISHEEFGYDETGLLQYCSVSNSIGVFYYNSWHIDDFPADYYEAIKYKATMSK